MKIEEKKKRKRNEEDPRHPSEKAIRSLSTSRGVDQDRQSDMFSLYRENLLGGSSRETAPIG